MAAKEGAASGLAGDVGHAHREELEVLEGVLSVGDLGGREGIEVADGAEEVVAVRELRRGHLRDEVGDDERSLVKGVEDGDCEPLIDVRVLRRERPGRERCGGGRAEEVGKAAVVRAEADGEHLDPGGSRVRRQVGLEAGDSRRGEALEADELVAALGGLVVGIVVVLVVLVVVIAGRRV